MLQNLFKNRKFIWSLVKQEIKGRYAGSMIGMFWTVLNPILTILVFVVIFSEVMAIKYGQNSELNNYIIYLCSGIIPWNSLSETVTRSINVFIDHSNLIKRVLFPKEILIAQILAATTINLIIGLILLLCVILFLGFPIGISILLLPVVIILQVIFSFGLSLIFSTLNVFFRDLSHLINIFLHLWFWITPVVYPIHIVPDKFIIIMKLNPVYHMMGMYRDILLYSNQPGIDRIQYFSLFTMAVFITGLFLFNHLRDEIPDEV